MFGKNRSFTFNLLSLCLAFLWLSVVLPASAKAVTYQYLGSFAVQDRPYWSSNPPPPSYTAREAAAVIYGGSAADYAISVNPSTDPSTITHSAWLDGYGDLRYCGSQGGSPASENYKLTGPNGFYNTYPSFSAYVSDHGCISRNYVWRVVVPTANNQSVTTAEDTAVPITLTATEPQGLPLTYTVTSNPAHGTLSGTAPNLTYTPAANFNGADSFQFKANSAVNGDSNTATVSINVTRVNDGAPVIGNVPASASVLWGSPVTFTATDRR